jgi:type IV secretion system protein VirD4
MIKQPSVYRNPPDPGFVGGYNWSAMFVGLLLLVLVNIGATQFVAYRLEYQPALGSPLLRYQLHSIYQPFAWAPWLLRYGSSADPRIRLPLLSGALIVVAGAAIAVILVYGMNLRRAKRLSANTEDLHGSARWATQTDIEATGLLDAQQGVYVGGWCTGRSNRLHYLRHNGPEHVLAFAPTRSGKGVGLVIPTLLAWSESAVVYDIKGENWAKTAGFRAKCGHLCFKFSPVELANGSRFNPLGVRPRNNRTRMNVRGTVQGGQAGLVCLGH